MSLAASHPRSDAVASAARQQPVSLSRLLVAGTVMLFAYVPLLRMFFSNLWAKPHYQYFPFVIAAFVWLLWERYKSGTPRPLQAARPNLMDAALPPLAAVLLIAAIVLHSPWFAMISLIVLMAFLCRAISTASNVTNLWGIWILLWLIVPLPFNSDQQLTKVLQLRSSRLSSFVLDWFGVRHLMDGNTLYLQSKPLFVDEACSGIISMLSIVACAVVYAVVKNRTPLHTILLAVMGIVWAAIMNVARISFIALALERWGIDWSAGTSHELLSLVLFLLAFLALLSMDQVLLVCLAPILRIRSDQHAREMHTGKWIAQIWDTIVTIGDPITSTASTAEVDRPLNPSTSPTPRFIFPVPWFAVLLFAPIAVIQTAVSIYAWNVVGPYRAVEQRAEAFAATDMPPTLCGLSKVDFEAFERISGNPDGPHSRTFTYRSDVGTTYTVSFDFSFAQYWHELTNCYRGNGWELVQRRGCPFVDSQSKESWEFVEGDFSKPGGEVGALWFAEFDQFGKPFEGGSDWSTRDITSWNMRQEYLQPYRIFQAQVWLTSSHDPTKAERQAGRELLLASRAIFRSKITGATSGETNISDDSDQAAASVTARDVQTTPATSAPIK